MQEKYVISQWLCLYNKILDRDYKVLTWPDERSSNKDIDALCKDDSAGELAIEHAHIEAFSGEKEDGARFMQTLAALENHPELLQQGYDIQVTQHLGAVPKGVDWSADV